MPLYDVRGNTVPQVFDVRGNSVEKTYSVDGRENELIEPFDLVVMTFNVGQWQAKNKTNNEDVLNTIFDTHKPDILGVQEHYTGASFDGGKCLNDNFGYIELGGMTHSSGNYMQVIASKHELKDATTVYFASNSYRNYQKMYIEHGGVRIAVFNTHLYWGGDASSGYGAETRRVQAEKLFAAVQEEQYAIITGDFNVLEASTDGADYKNILKPFVDAGYHCANPFNGQFFDTCFEVNNGVFETFPTDSIITSPNIRIDRVVVDYTKSSGEYPTEAYDHMPLVAYITVT